MFRKLVLAGSASVLLAVVIGTGANFVRHRDAEALTNCTTGTMALNSGEQQLLELINAYRQENGRPALSASPNLSRAAAWMSENLTANGLWSHTDSLGRSPFTRVPDCGYGSSGIGENIARTSSAQGAFNLWLSSPDHNRNMLHSSWKVVGIGQAGSIWTADFGSLNDSSEPWDGAVAPPPSAIATATPTRTPTRVPTATPTATPAPPLVIPRATLQMLSAE
jgi:hypothetical protein